jgi:hypothetical protein
MKSQLVHALAKVEEGLARWQAGTDPRRMVRPLAVLGRLGLAQDAQSPGSRISSHDQNLRYPLADVDVGMRGFFGSASRLL